MKISARNQFAGKIVSINEGAVNGIVTLDADGMMISSTISMAAIKELGLEQGVEATAVIKATEVLVARGDMKISARNKFAGKVVSVAKGAVNGIVCIEVAGNKISATISNAAIEELELAEGVEAVAVVKATSVMIAR